MTSVDAVLTDVFGISSSSDSSGSDVDSDGGGNEEHLPRRAGDANFAPTSSTSSTSSVRRSTLRVHPAVLVSVKRFVLEYSHTTLDDLAVAAGSASLPAKLVLVDYAAQREDAVGAAATTDKFLALTTAFQNAALRSQLAVAVDALRQDHLGKMQTAAEFLSNATWGYLLQHGAWPAVPWREVYGYAQVMQLAWAFAEGTLLLPAPAPSAAAAAVAGHSDHPSVLPPAAAAAPPGGGLAAARATPKAADVAAAARRLDMCYIMGVPPVSLRMLNAIVARELAASAHADADAFWSGHESATPATPTAAETAGSSGNGDGSADGSTGGRFLALPARVLLPCSGGTVGAENAAHARELRGAGVGLRVPIDTSTPATLLPEVFKRKYWDTGTPVLMRGALLPCEGSTARAVALRNMTLLVAEPGSGPQSSSSSSASPPSPSPLSSSSSPPSAAAAAVTARSACSGAPGQPIPSAPEAGDSGWGPALAHWSDLQYLDRLYGGRHVPIEVYRDGRQSSCTSGGGGGGGSSGDGSGASAQTGQDSGGGGGAPAKMREEVMSFATFVRDFIRPSQVAVERALVASAKANEKAQQRVRIASDVGCGGGCGGGASEASTGEELLLRVARAYKGPVAYLAQHSLFEQFPELAKDFRPPALAAAAPGGVTTVNAWFGTAGTVTPLHFDSYNNFFVQVVGCKLVRLYAPDQTPFLYVHEAAEAPAAATHAQGNISQVDVEHPDLSAHPRFAEATCVFRP